MIVRYSTGGLTPSRGVQVSRLLRGRAGRPGLVQPPGVPLGRGASLLPPAQAQAVRDALDQVGVPCDALPVWRDV